MIKGLCILLRRYFETKLSYAKEKNNTSLTVFYVKLKRVHIHCVCHTHIT